MSYFVKEIFYTLQGEGARTGRAAVFCRFMGCNLWTGREEHRSTAVCQFCDTDFVGTDGAGGGTFATPKALAEAVESYWPQDGLSDRYVVCTGGEPCLQLDKKAVDAFHEHGFEVAIETNGTLFTPWGVDWICMSPKAGAQLAVKRGQELKLVYPQFGFDPEMFADYQFAYFYLQPMDGPNLEANTYAAIAYCLAHPQWRLSLQTHKIIGLR